MDGKFLNSTGRCISLLNNESEKGPAFPHASTTSQSHYDYARSRTSSYASSSSTTTSSSARTPPLVRSGSADSRSMTSPITPTFDDGFDVLDNSQRLDPAMFAPNPALFPTPDQAMKSYAVRTQEPNFRYPAPEVATNPYFQPLSPAIEQQPPITRPSQPQLQTQHQPQQQPQSASKPPSKKNTYPCPLSKEFSCNDFFTTSGHAARHAKKHTGRKDAICPDCNKAFTRKDNMEQHRRTHQNGRNVAKAGSDASSSSSRKPKPSLKRPKPASLHQATAPLIDPTLPASPASSFGFNDVASVPTMQHAYPSLYQEPVAYPGLIPDYQRQPSFTVGLDALAIAATGDGSKRRKLDI